MQSPESAEPTGSVAGRIARVTLAATRSAVIQTRQAPCRRGPYAFQDDRNGAAAEQRRPDGQAHYQVTEFAITPGLLLALVVSEIVTVYLDAERRDGRGLGADAGRGRARVQGRRWSRTERA